MRVDYTEDDVVVLRTGRPAKGGVRPLWYNPGVMCAFERQGSENITRVDIHVAKAWLPLGSGAGCYDADTDTMIFGVKPELGSDSRVVDHGGDFVGYWQRIASDYDLVGLGLRHASEHLAPVIATLPQPLDIRMR